MLSVDNSHLHCLKKPESFSHSRVFRCKLPRQLRLNTPKHPRSKIPSSAACDFSEMSAEVSRFFANVNAGNPPNYVAFLVTWYVTFSGITRPRPAARNVMRTACEWCKGSLWIRTCAPLTKTQVWDSGFFAHALFVPKTPNAMDFSASVNGRTKNPEFFAKKFWF